MASRNENRAPPRNSSIKNVAATKEASQKVAAAKVEKQGRADGRVRTAFSSVTNRTNNAVNDADGGGAERAAVDFTKEEVEALMNEKMKNGSDKKSVEQRADIRKRFRLCVRWLERVVEGHVQENEKLRSELEAAEKKCSDKETEIEELKETISDLRKKNSSLEERFVKEESDKLEAINSYEKEKEARSEAEKVRDDKSAELEKVLNEKSVAEQKAISNEDLYKRSQEYNMSLQQYNSRLQSDLDTANEAHKQGEIEKAAIVESLGNARVHNKALQVSLNETVKKNEILANELKCVHETLNLCQVSLNEAIKKNEISANELKCVHEELNLCQVSLNEAIKKNEILANELKCVHEELKQIRDDRDCQMGQVHALTVEIAKYKEYTGKTCTQLDTLMTKTNDLEETCASQKEQIHILQRQLFVEKEKSKMADLSASETRTLIEEQRRIISEQRDQLADKEFQLVEKENQRKKLHNENMELKGNIRVFCRVRPPLPEDSTGTDMVISYPTSTEELGRGIELVQSGQKHNFTFDEVFNHEASQQDVFIEISQLVQSALDGYKVCIFAYGQTGSGKTYTMMGRPDAPDQKGLIPRSLEQIFQASQSLKDLGWKYSMRASILEIYNETIRDLLSSNRSSGNDQTRSENNVPSKQYTIKHDANGNTEVLGLTVVDVSSVNEISSLLQQAAQSRSVGRTQMNEQSSRSHFVFTLRICGKDENTGKLVQGVLNLIDLAGSERLSRSGATGDRLKETQAINKSLSSLSDVIFALAKKEEHVPFRNSKLTYLLQPCLGGNSKTLMFVNISPDQSSTNESLCSLRFASRVNACEIGIPRRQTHHTSRRTSDARLSYG